MNLNNQRGQGLVEYILIVVLMGVLAIAAVQRLSDSTEKGFSKASRELDRAFGG